MATGGAPAQCARRTCSESWRSASASASSSIANVRSKRENSAADILAFSCMLRARQYAPPAGLHAAMTAVRAGICAVKPPFATHTYMRALRGAPL